MDKFSKKIRSKIMQSIRGRDTKMELDFRKELSRLGIRYRKNASRLFGAPDLAFPEKKLVVFFDSCFWHVCPRHFVRPKSNRGYWVPKMRANVRRDRAVNAYYRKNGWKVMRIWEHEIKKNRAKKFNGLLRALGVGSQR